MKKLSLIAALTLSTMLSACGGGGGGGHSFIPPTTLPDTENGDYTISNANSSNSNITGMTAVATNNDFSQLINDTLVDAYSSTPSTTSSGRSMFRARRMSAVDYTENTNICKSANDCNQEIFNNMVKILIEKDLVNASAKEIRDALIVAGFKDDIAGMWDDINQLIKFIKDNPDRIKSNTDNIIDTYGISLADTKMNLLQLHEDKQSSYIRLTVGDDKKINGIDITQNEGKASEAKYILARNGDENGFGKTYKVYRYGINSPYYTGLYIESLTPLDDDARKSKLEKRVDELSATGLFNETDVSNLKDAIYGRENNNIQILENTTGDVVDSDEFRNNGGDNEKDRIQFFSMTYDKSEKITYNSYAKDMGLIYSDFGVINKTINNSQTVFEGTDKEVFVFAGGYKDKKIDIENISQDMTFTGKAEGAVNVIFGENEGPGQETKDPLVLSDKTATLSFESATGNQQLNAQFNNWYDVQVDSGSSGNKLTLTNGDKIADNDYKFRGQNTYVVDDFTTAKQLISERDTAVDASESPSENNAPAFGALDIGYYGDNNKPTEATGFVYYEESQGYKSEGSNEIDMIKNINVNFGFGMKKD